MFDFEKLAIYQKAKLFTLEIRTYLNHNSKLDRTTKDQLHRASYSILLNLAEGSGRFSRADRRHFFVVSRSSIFECIAILDILKEERKLSRERFQEFYELCEEMSKIIYALIKKYS